MAHQKVQTLLIADDSEINRAILSEMFIDDYRIVEAENGRAAIEKIQELDGCLTALFLDIVMPEIDGFGVLEYLHLHQMMNEFPVFMITAETDMKMILHGYDMGVADIINKPIEPIVVRRRLSNAIELFLNRNHLASQVAEQVQLIRRQADELRSINISIIDTLSSVIEFRSGESGSHVRRIREATYTLFSNISRIRPDLKLDQNAVEAISSAAAMHDIGKISIPDYILNKPGRLTAEEFEIMKRHTVYGCDILESITVLKQSELYQYAYDICRYHHERWDGKGYPDGLKGDEIPLWAQVVSLADVYDALVSDRVYKKALSHEKALKMIAGGECGAFNPTLLQYFLSMADYLRDTLYTSSDELGASQTSPLPTKYTAVSTAAENLLTQLETERQKTLLFSLLSDDIMFYIDFRTDTIEYTRRCKELFPGPYRRIHATDYLQNNSRLLPEDLEALRCELKNITQQNPDIQTTVQVHMDKGEYRSFKLHLYFCFSNEASPERTGCLGKMEPVNEQQN